MTLSVMSSPVTTLDAATIEKVLIGGDLSKLTEAQRVGYYKSVCESLGLNPLTKPFNYIVLNGKLTLYARRDATEQLRKIHSVSVTSLEKQFHEGLYIVTALVSDKSGRSDASTGAVAIKGLTGENLANALMKAETKAKRRATLSICGLGMLDETEAADVTPATPTLIIEAPKVEQVDKATGEVVEAAPVVPPGLPGHVRLIMRCEGGTGKKAGTVSFSDGNAATVWASDQQLFALCCELMQKAALVIPDLLPSKNPQYGPTLKGITRYHGEEGAQEPSREQPPEPPIAVHADDIPFLWLLPLVGLGTLWLVGG